MSGISVEFGMDPAKQARKFDGRIAVAPSVDAACYLAYLKGRMLASVAVGRPNPASALLPMYEEEFDVV
jgi:hypothetical protein